MRPDQNELWERYEDAMFAILMDEVAHQEGQEQLEWKKQLNDDPSAALPEEVRKKGEKTIRKAFAAQGRRSAKHIGFRMFQRIAVAVMLVILTAVCAFAAFPEIRTGILNTIVKTFENHTEFEFSSGTDSATQQYEVKPEWLPEGFTLSQSGSDYFSVWQLYTGTDDPNSSIYITKDKIEDQSLSVDTENASIQKLSIQGYESTLITKETWSCILLTIPEEGALIHIETEGVATDDTVKIAENIDLTS